MLPSHEYVREYMHYDPEEGILRWVKKPCNAVLVGTAPKRFVRFGAERPGITHVIWFYMTGEWPEYEIDHKDRNHLNQKWENLRLADRGANCRNRVYPPGISGVRGVQFSKTNKSKPWWATVYKNKKAVSVGFATKEEAVEAIGHLRQSLHQEFACHD